MNIQKLRPTKSQWRTPLLTAAEAQARVRPAPAAQGPKAPVAAPDGKGGELWWQVYPDALLRGHEDPERVADTALRSREKALALQESRPKSLLTTTPPKPQETAVVNKARKPRAVVHDAFRCNALTLEGRRCGFKATCGDFCKKHDVSKEKI